MNERKNIVYTCVWSFDPLIENVDQSLMAKAEKDILSNYE